MRVLPFLRRLLKTALPEADFIRRRKPCLRLPTRCVGVLRFFFMVYEL